MAQSNQPQSILSQIEFDSAHGALTLNNTRYLLIRPETIIGIQKEMEKTIGFKKAADVLYNGGFEGGSRTSRRLSAEMGLSAEDIVRAMCSMGTQIGWGAFSPAQFSKSSSYFEISVQSSIYAQAYGNSKAPVCHLIAGVFGSVATVIFDKKIKVIEKKCAAVIHSPAECYFVTSDHDTF